VTDSNAVNTDATNKLAAVGGNTTAITIGADDGFQSNISDEWTRFLANRPDVTDSTILGNQKIVTYTVEVNPQSDNQGRANTALLKSVGSETTGNGGYVGVTTAGGGTDLAAVLLDTFAKIKAVNSVFAASTLPVSVNVRGSFLNQVYMGVFRPDPNSFPRWPGNVKQYQLNAVTSGGKTTVFLADKNGVAIENPNTGFVVPTATSFWSSASTFWDTTYYPNVKTDLVSASNTDAPDGEFVEKGGAAQRLRQTYPGPTGTPPGDITQRKLYTCLSAAGCAGGTILSSSVAHEFVATNGDITDTALQISGPQTVSSIAHTVGTAIATVTTASNHNFANNSVVAIANATQSQYNGSFNVTVTGATTFTIPVTETPVTPATTATALTAAKGSASAVDITSMTHGAGSGTPPTVTVTVTTASNHGFANNQLITILNANQTEYNGSHTVTVTGLNTFTFTLPETPTTPASLAGNAKATKVGSSSGKNINSIARTGTSALVTTQNNHGFAVNDQVTISGSNTTEYNGTFTVVTVPSTTTFTYTITVGPTTPATTSTTMKADPGTVLSIASITRSGTTATVTTTTDPTAAPASFANGDNITISGATQTEYNGTFAISSINAAAKTFQYTVPVKPTSESTAGITATGSGGITKAELVNWVRGANVQLDDNPSVTPTANSTLVRAYLHGDVLHSRPAVINYNRTSQPADRDLVVYYGANDGIIHAVKGGQNAADGVEKWGFIPTEFYDKFVRLFLQNPVISSTATRTYFADGPISVNAVYNSDTTTTPPTERMEGVGAKAQIYIGMRRGGRYYYSLDVTDPDAPKFLWKIDNTTADFAELGQSWSEMKVVKVKIGSNCPSAVDSQGNCKVLIFGAGYDAAANDVEPQGTATMGRGIFIIDATTGQHIWSASPNAFGPTAGVHKQVAGMTFSIAADMAVINSDLDVQNLADRIYAVDLGGNIWRVNISDADPSNWNVGQLAALSASGAANQRRFLFPPDVVAFDSTTDSVLVGSGDREHPFDVTIANRFYMIKDSHAMTALPATPITETDLVDLTSNTLQDPSASQATLDTINQALKDKSGWFIALATGEKTVTGSTTLGGTTIFATNTPASVSTPGSCTGPLGKALIYGVDFKDATATIDFNLSGTVTQGERSEERVGGGLPPTPIPFSTQIGSNFYEGAITGTQIVQPPTAPIGQRYRVFWNLSVDN
jgi:type IV pilus assembly protein PilY1